MVKKISKPDTTADASAEAGSSQNLADSVKASAHQIWLAGMGAFAKAQAEGGKVFEKLVKEGTSLQRKTQGMAEEKISEVSGKMTAMADTVTAKAGQNWDKLESIFETRTAKAMSKLGVPTAKEVAALVARVQALEAAAGKASRSVAKPSVKPSAKPSAAKPAVASAAPVAPAAPVKKTAAKRVTKKA